MTDGGVSVIIATRNRPGLLRRAIRSINAQTTERHIEIVVVFDRVDIDPLEDMHLSSNRTLITLSNERLGGLAGSRNTGIETASHALVAFCDDDDEWLSSKLNRQLELRAEVPDATLVATGIRIESSGGSHERPSPPVTRLDDLLKSRITELHPSSFLIERAALLGPLGLLDEDIPASYAEDYDLLLRAAKLGDIIAVPDALVIVHWDRTSYFSDKWEGVASGLRYLLKKHPEFDFSPVGKARIEGQVAFALAALGNLADAKMWASRALRNDRLQLRAYLAYAIAARLVPATLVVNILNRRGKGI